MSIPAIGAKEQYVLFNLHPYTVIGQVPSKIWTLSPQEDSNGAHDARKCSAKGISGDANLLWPKSDQQETNIMPEANIKVTPTFRFQAICNFQAQNIGSMRTRISDTALTIVLIIFTT